MPKSVYTILCFSAITRLVSQSLKRKNIRGLILVAVLVCQHALIPSDHVPSFPLVNAQAGVSQTSATRNRAGSSEISYLSWTETFVKYTTNNMLEK